MKIVPHQIEQKIMTNLKSSEYLKIYNTNTFQKAEKFIKL